MPYSTEQVNELNDIANLSKAPIVITGEMGTNKAAVLRLVATAGRKFYAPNLDESVSDNFDASYNDIFSKANPEALVIMTREDGPLYNEIKEKHEVFTHIKCFFQIDDTVSFYVTHHGDTMRTQAELIFTPVALELLKYVCQTPLPIVILNGLSGLGDALAEYVVKTTNRQLYTQTQLAQEMEIVHDLQQANVDITLSNAVLSTSEPTKPYKGAFILILPVGHPKGKNGIEVIPTEKEVAE